MKIDHEVREHIESDFFTLYDVKIADEKYNLAIENLGSVLFIKFKKGELDTYEIIVSDNGIQLKRLALRPGHDHNDTEMLAKNLEWKQLNWNEIHEQALKIPFGLRLKDDDIW